MAITIRHIHAAADKLAAAGRKPTQSAVRAMLGGGSFSTISDALKTWRKEQEDETFLMTVEVPEAISERGQAFQAALWQVAMIEAEHRLQGEREALAAKSEALDAELAEAREAVQVLEEEAERAQAEKNALQEQNIMLEARAEKAETALHELEKAMAAIKVEAELKVEGLTARLTDAQKTIESLMKIAPTAKARTAPKAPKTPPATPEKPAKRAPQKRKPKA